MPVARRPSGDQRGKIITQTVLIPGSWSREEAVRWLKDHGFITSALEGGGETMWRSRQYNPEDFAPGGMDGGQDFLTLTLPGGSGIKLVNGRVKAAKAVDVTDQDDADLQAAQVAAVAFVEAARVWSSRTLELVKAPPELVVEITEVPSMAAKLADELARLTPGRTSKADEATGFKVAVDDLVRTLQVLLPALTRVGAEQEKAVAVALGWLLGLQDLQDRVEEARTMATKSLPGGGVHAHELEDGLPDGAHVHILRLPGGQVVLTGRDGAHLHQADHLLAQVPGGAHSHVFKLPDGRELEVASSGLHVHELEEDGEETTHGGVHVHEVELDGERMSTLLPDTALDKRAMWSSPGGKATLAKRLAAVIPKGRTYVEPFAGSGAVLFERDKAEREVLADINPDNIMAFKVVQGLTEVELDKLEAMGWSADRETFNILKASSPEPGTVAWLRKFLYLRVFSVGGQGKSYSGDLPRTTQNSRVIQTIRRLQPRIKGVVFKVADYRDTIKAEDGPDTVFFLDPPYRGYSNMGLGEADFDEVEFREVLDAIKGRFVLTYGSKGELDLSGFHVHRVNVQNNTSLGGKKGGRRGQFLETLVASNVELDWTGVADSYTDKVAKLADRPAGSVMSVFKADRPEEERYILGVVLEPNDGENGVPFNPDTQGDVYSAAEIRQAAHLFMEHYRNLGHQHRELVTGGKLRILESYVALVDMVVLHDGRAVGYPSILEAIKSGKVEIPPEAQVIYRGTWLLGMRVVDDGLWGDFKTGRITGLSIGGSARRSEEPAPPGVSQQTT